MKYIEEKSKIQDELLDRFIKYVKIWTESNGLKADSGKIPSEDREFDLAKYRLLNIVIPMDIFRLRKALKMFLLFVS